MKSFLTGLLVGSLIAFSVTYKTLQSKINKADEKFIYTLTWQQLQNTVQPLQQLRENNFGDAIQVLEANLDTGLDNFKKNKELLSKEGSDLRNFVSAADMYRKKYPIR